MKTTIALVPDAYIKAVLSGMIILLTERYVLYSTCGTFDLPTHHGIIIYMYMYVCLGPIVNHWPILSRPAGFKSSWAIHSNFS